MADGRRADTVRRRQRVITALDNAVAAGAEIGVSAIARGRAAASFTLDDRGARIVHGTDEVKSALDIFVKDMSLVTDAARTCSYPTRLASAAEQLYLAGRRAGLGRHDDSTVIEVLRGAPLKPT
jgi:3-hydroxyisobutyrate dehydrogenase